MRASKSRTAAPAPQSSPGTTKPMPRPAADDAGAGRRPAIAARPRRPRRTGIGAGRLSDGRTAIPLPYAYAKAHTLLLEDDGARLVLWAPETVGLPALSEVLRLYDVDALRARVGEPRSPAASPRRMPAASRAPRSSSARSRARSTCRA